MTNTIPPAPTPAPAAPEPRYRPSKDARLTEAQQDAVEELMECAHTLKLALENVAFETQKSIESLEAGRMASTSTFVLHTYPMTVEQGHASLQQVKQRVLAQGVDRNTVVRAIRAA